MRFIYARIALQAALAQRIHASDEPDVGCGHVARRAADRIENALDHRLPFDHECGALLLLEPEILQHVNREQQMVEAEADLRAGRERRRRAHLLGHCFGEVAGTVLVLREDRLKQVQPLLTSAQRPADEGPPGTPLRSFRGLLDHLATLTRNDIRYHGINTDVPTLAEPTPEQRRAFELIGATIPLTIAA